MSECYGVGPDLVWGYGGSHGGDGNGDRALMPARIPDGFDQAFEGLYRLAYRVAFRILGDRGDAEDVAQEALARAAVRWSRLKDRPEGWVTRVASNLAIDRYRRRKRPAPPLTGPVGIVDPHLGERGDLVVALRRLPAATARSRRPALPRRPQRSAGRPRNGLLGGRGEEPRRPGPHFAAPPSDRIEGKGRGRCLGILTTPTPSLPAKMRWQASCTGRSASAGDGVVGAPGRGLPARRRRRRGIPGLAPGRASGSRRRRRAISSTH